MITNPMEEVSQAYSAVVQRAWKNSDYKARLLAKPREVLGEAGIALPDGVEIAALESTPDKTYFVLPSNPAQLGDAELDSVAGGIDPVTVSTVVCIAGFALLGLALAGMATGTAIAFARDHAKKV